MKKLIFLSLFGFLPFMILAQGLSNNGAKIVITSGTTVYLNGGNSGNYTSAGTGEIDLDGILKIEGDFINNGSTNAFRNVDSDGEVIFSGATQSITSNSADMSNFINFEKVTINSGSTTSLTAGSAATANGILTVNGDFVLKTPANENPTGSLITLADGSANGIGSITVERYSKVGNRWLYVSSPLTGQQSDLFTENTPSGNFNPNYYSYNEAFDQNALADPSNTNYSNYEYISGYNFWQAWEQVQATAGSPVAMNVGQGYITYNEADIQVDFSSSNPADLNDDANYIRNISYTLNDGNGGFYDGWNLIGNPYQSALDWNSFDKTDISNTVYLWDGDNGNYVYYNNGGDDHIEGVGQSINNTTGNPRYIPAMQSFMVKSTAVSSTITIPSSARTHHSNTMYKSTSKDETVFSYVKLQASNENGQTDEMLVRFLEEATPEIDDNFDAYKMFATTANLPQIYSLVNNQEVETPLAINSLPINEDYNKNSEEPKSVPLGFVAKEEGNYTIKATELTNFDFEKIYLVDRTDDQNYIQIDLSEGAEYSFFIEEGEVRDRFYLFFLPEETTTNLFENNNTSNNDVKIYSNSNQVFLNINSENNINGTVTIYDITGKKVLEAKANSTFNTFSLNSASGNYIVRYNTSTNVYTKKVFIK